MFDWMQGNKFLMSDEGIPTLLGVLIIFVVMGLALAVIYAIFFGFMGLILLGMVLFGRVAALDVAPWVLIVGGLLVLFIVACIHALFKGLSGDD